MNAKGDGLFAVPVNGAIGVNGIILGELDALGPEGTETLQIIQNDLPVRGGVCRGTKELDIGKALVPEPLDLRLPVILLGHKSSLIRASSAACNSSGEAMNKSCCIPGLGAS